MVTVPKMANAMRPVSWGKGGEERGGGVGRVDSLWARRVSHVLLSAYS